MPLIPTTAVVFRAVIVLARAHLKAPHRLALTLHTPDEYAAMRCFAANRPHDRGFAITADGELVNMFSYPKDRGDELIERAIVEGATFLDAYEGPAADLYRRHGFVETSRIPFDIAFAQPGWQVARWGAPDVLTMELR